MATTDLSLVHLERELVCFICTDLLYQPLTLIDCLHTFCGRCSKQWFSFQRQSASSSHSSTPTSNPYTCPTCRSPVKDARRDPRVNTYLDMVINANPSRARSQEDRDEYDAIYTPGENILPRPESGRRRERRTRRDEDEARDRRMIEEARERSMRDIHGSPAQVQNNLQPPQHRSHDQTSRSRDREREERRERRREQARREQREHALAAENASRTQDQTLDRIEVEDPVILPPASSPRHPEAVEARQRQQTVAHQASLISLISSSEDNSSTGTGDSIDEARVYQEIMAAGLLDGIDIDSMTEAEQDMLAERIAEAYRQRRRASQQNHASSQRSAPSREVEDGRLMTVPAAGDERRRRRSGSRQRRADTSPTPARERQTDRRNRSSSNQTTEAGLNLQPPQSIVTHRRRTSNQNQPSAMQNDTSRHASPGSRANNGGSRSATDLGSNVHLERSTEHNVNASTVSRPEIDPQIPSRAPEVIPSTTNDVARPAISHESSLNAVSPQQPYAELADTGHSNSRPITAATIQPPANSAFHGLSQFDEPSVSCYRCHRADIQYEVYKHCPPCNIDLCLRCYRGGRGCKHWYGFGHAAMAKFEGSATSRRESEAVELPHVLIGRSTKRPDQSMILDSKLAKDGRTVIPLVTRSNPSTRTQEGHFCDRCGAFANTCFWSCDFCNEGDWGFCRDCVNTHHCCTHPLLPIAHRNTVPASQIQQITQNQNSEFLNLTSSDPHSAHLQASSGTSRPSSATSVLSSLAGSLPGYVNLNIPTQCDVCRQSIAPSSTRYHCPFHSTPMPMGMAVIGDYDICIPCYHDLVKTNRIKRDDGPAGWRKCPTGHRMIITTFESDVDGGHRRVLLNDLVGGWKMTMFPSAVSSSPATSPLDDSANPIGTWTWREDPTSMRRATRARTLTISPVSSHQHKWRELLKHRQPKKDKQKPENYSNTNRVDPSESIASLPDIKSRRSVNGIMVDLPKHRK